jgi:hypothetical protein
MLTMTDSVDNFTFSHTLPHFLFPRTIKTLCSQRLQQFSGTLFAIDLPMSKKFSTSGVTPVNEMHKISNLPKFVLLIFVAAILLSAGSASAAAEPPQAAGRLLDIYNSNVTRLEINSFGLPLFLDSFERGDRVHVDVYGILGYSFSSIVKVLKVPANWCDIVSIHPNVKACTYSEPPDTGMLTFYIGKKVYQPPQDTSQVKYKYRIGKQQPGYLDITLTADAGPFGTKDHGMRFEALPLDGGRTFVHVSYEYSDSVALRLTGKAYFATLGRGKVGFTVTGTGKNGKPVYIGGPRGAIERNAVRYYFAIQTFMNTMQYPEKRVFSMRISEWYDLTSRYRKQLFDLEKKEYLASKTIEHSNQLTLQRRVGATAQ